MLITTSSSSMYFFQFLWCATKCPTSTGMTLMLIMVHIFFYFSIYFLVSLNFFLLFSFSLTLMSQGIAISIMAQLPSFLFTTTISGFLALISLSHWIITSQAVQWIFWAQAINHPCKEVFSQIAWVIYCLP